MRACAMTTRGPSSRVRGAAAGGEPRLAVAGTIPAGAGSRVRLRGGVGRSRDHPRGCGEQRSSGDSLSTYTGPSPRVRGAVEPAAVADAIRGTIPAGAGSRSARSPSRRRTWDHPRGCGEQVTQPPPAGCAVGPSPRVRGAVAVTVLLRIGAGTIPAGAGSSTTASSSVTRRRDHPRGCREQALTPMSLARSRGPSPRARGAAVPGYRAEEISGTIPAGAGSRGAVRGTGPPRRDHPRGCGEQVGGMVTHSTGRGPSLRVRGAEEHAQRRSVRRGTIPAGAGSSRTGSRPTRAGRDHPRGCGEQSTGPVGRPGSGGPSPRVRGADWMTCCFSRSGSGFRVLSQSPAYGV